jgi:hypothetical protein
MGFEAHLSILITARRTGGGWLVNLFVLYHVSLYDCVCKEQLQLVLALSELADSELIYLPLGRTALTPGLVSINATTLHCLLAFCELVFRFVF